MPAQLKQDEKITLHYFGVRGAASLATVCFEQAGVDYEAKAYMMDTWPEFKPTGPNPNPKKEVVVVTMTMTSRC